MALTGKKLDLILGMKLNEFFNATRKANVHFEKMRGNIEKKPIRIKASGTNDILKKLGLISAAYMALRKVSQDYIKSETNLANVASLGVKNIQELSKGIDRIAQDVPIALHDIEAGLYEVVSAGVDASNQIDVLESSAKAAKAGLSTTTDALKLGSAVIKGYGEDWGEFDKIMDMAFQTVKLGQTNFEGLASNMGKIIPLASTLGVGVEELFGAMATLTGVTGDASEVATQLRGVMAATAKPTADLDRLFKNYGGAQKALKQLGLAGYLKEIQDATGGNAQEMAKLVPRVEALNAVIALSSTQYETFVEKTDQMRKSSGAAEGAFAKQADTIESKIVKLDNTFQVFAKGGLASIEPLISMLLESGVEILQWFNSLDEGTKKASLSVAALAIIVPRLALAIKGLYASMGPAGWLILGIGAAATAFTLLSSSADDAAEAMEDFRKEVKAFNLQESETELINLNNQFDELYRKIKTLREAEFKGGHRGGGILGMALGSSEQIREAQEELGLLLDKINAIKERISTMRGTGAEGAGVGDGLDLPPTESDVSAAIERIRAYKAALAEAHMATEKAIDETLKDEMAMLGKIKIESKGLFKSQVDGVTLVGDAMRDSFVNSWLDAESTMGDYLEAFIDAADSILRKLAEIRIANAALEGGSGEGIFGSILGGVVGSFLGSPGIGMFLGSLLPFDEGGVIGSVVKSSLKAPGDDGLISAQVGEMVMNRNATSRYYPVLERINQAGRRPSGFATGGMVSDSDIVPGAGLGSADIGRLVDAISGVQININSAMDYLQFYRETFPKYEKDRNQIRRFEQ